MSKTNTPIQPVATLDKFDVDSEVISKSNDLVNGFFDVTTVEYQFITTALMIVSQKNEANEHYDETTVFEITAVQFQKIWGLNEVSKIGYKNLKRVAVSVQQKGFWYYGLNKKMEYKLTFSSWFSYIQPAEHGSVKFGFPPPMIELLKSYRRKFTWFYFQDARKLKKLYSWRLYEFIHQYKHIDKDKMPTVKLSDNKIRITVDRLRAMYQLQDKYPKMCDFRSKIIDQSVDEINANTSLHLTATPEKNGRNIVAFIIEYKFTDNKMLDRDKAFNIDSKESKKDQDTPDIFTGMTEKTKKYFCSLLCNDYMFSSNHAAIGEEPKPFEKRILKELDKPEFLHKIMADLIRLGYDPNFKERNKSTPKQ